MSASSTIVSCRRPLPGFPNLAFMSLGVAEAAGAGPLSKLPYSLRALADSLLRHESAPHQIRALAEIGAAPLQRDESAFARATLDFHPERILMQDSSGLPVLADIAALMEAREALGIAGEEAIRLKADFVVDHAVEVDYWARADAATRNLAAEFQRNESRFRFLKWAGKRFPWLRIAPPGSGICHQLNLELFASVVGVKHDLVGVDTVLGTDSHTTMVNALSVFGWGVGGIEATSVLLDNPVSLPLPRVVGVNLHGRLPAGTTTTDLALSLTAMLRGHKLVGKIVEFCGAGLATLSVPDRATVANMAPEYGATMGFFPADSATIAYLRSTGRDDRHVAIAESFLRAQDLLWSADKPLPVFEQMLEFDLSSVKSTVSGPARPDQKLSLDAVPETVPEAAADTGGLKNGDVVIAAITSCTNTSNPRLLVAAGLLAEKATRLGFLSKPWVKSSLAPGSRIASGILAESGLQAALDKLGFALVGHGCTTCMGNSGPLPDDVVRQIQEANLSVAAVLSGNRNFEGRIHPNVRLAYLMSPALVVAYALAGNTRIDLTREPLGAARDGKQIMLADIWPSETEIDDVLKRIDTRKLALNNREWAFQASPAWEDLAVPGTPDYPWEGDTGFIRRPPFLEPEISRPQLGHDIQDARALLMLGDAVTTDHISPVSRILPGSAAGTWLAERGVAAQDFTSFSARRLNHDVMLRGGFANPRLKNRLADREGGFTTLFPEGRIMPVHEAAAIYRARKVPMIVIAGDRYGAGSARDWAAKVTRLLGISAVIAENFERIHRVNLVAMGVLPLRIDRNDRARLSGRETFAIAGLPKALHPRGTVELRVQTEERAAKIMLECQIETEAEAEWLRAGGILAQTLRHEQALVAAR